MSARPVLTVLTAFLTVVFARAEEPTYVWQLGQGNLAGSDISPDGRYLVGSGPRHIYVWDLLLKKLVKTQQVNGRGNFTHFLPNGSQLLSPTGGSSGSNLQLWNFPDLTVANDYRDLRVRFEDYAIHPSSASFYYPSLNGVREVLLPSGSTTLLYPGDAACALSRDGNWVGGLDTDGVGTVANRVTQQVIGTFPTGEQPGRCALTRDGKLLFTSTRDGVVRGWSTVTQNLYSYWPGFSTGGQIPLTLTPDEKHVIVTDRTRVSVFSVTSGLLVNSFPTNFTAQGSVLAPDGRSLYVSGDISARKGTTQKFDIFTGLTDTPLETLNWESRALVSSTSTVFATDNASSGVKTTQFWRMDDGKLLGSFSYPTGGVTAISVDGQFLLQLPSSSGTSFDVLNRVDGSLVTTISDPQFHLAELSFSPDGELLGVYGTYGSGQTRKSRMRFYNAHTFQFMNELIVGDQDGDDFSWSFDGRYFTTKSRLNGASSLRVFETASRLLKLTTTNSSAVGFSKSPDRFYSQFNGVIQIADIANGTFRYLPISDQIVGVSPLGDAIVCAYDLTSSPRNSRLRFKSLVDGSTLKEFSLPLGTSMSVTYLADGQSLIVASGNDVGLLFRMQNPLLGEARVDPDLLTVQLGKISVGNVASLASLDNLSLTVCKFVVPNQNGPSVQFTIEGTSPYSQLTALRLQCTAKIDITGSFNHALEMWDWVNQRWDPVDRRDDPLTKTFQSFNVDASGNISRYVHPTSKRVKARMTLTRTGVTAAFNWCTSHDQLNWKVTQ